MTAKAFRTNEVAVFFSYFPRTEKRVFKKAKPMISLYEILEAINPPFAWQRPTSIKRTALDKYASVQREKNRVLTIRKFDIKLTGPLFQIAFFYWKVGIR